MLMEAGYDEAAFLQFESLHSQRASVHFFAVDLVLDGNSVQDLFVRGLWNIRFAHAMGAVDVAFGNFRVGARGDRRTCRLYALEADTAHGDVCFTHLHARHLLGLHDCRAHALHRVGDIDDVAVAKSPRLRLSHADDARKTATGRVLGDNSPYGMRDDVDSCDDALRHL